MLPVAFCPLSIHASTAISLGSVGSWQFAISKRQVLEVPSPGSCLLRWSQALLGCGADGGGSQTAATDRNKSPGGQCVPGISLLCRVQCASKQPFVATTDSTGGFSCTVGDLPKVQKAAAVIDWLCPLILPCFCLLPRTDHCCLTFIQAFRCVTCVNFGAACSGCQVCLCSLRGLHIWLVCSCFLAEKSHSSQHQPLSDSQDKTVKLRVNIAAGCSPRT